MSICAPTISQRLAIIAVSGACDDHLNAIVQSYHDAARTLVSGLVDIGFEYSVPMRAFYVYADCHGIGQRTGVETSLQLCHKLLYNCTVACTPGIDFDEQRAQDFIRFSVAGSRRDVDEGTNRIASFLSQFPNA